MEKGFVLCSTLHDPRAGLLGTFKRAAEMVKESGFNRWVINVTPATDLEVIKELRALADLGVVVIETQLDREHRLAENVIADDHFRVVQKAVEIAEELGLQKIFYCDGDRVNMAAREYPEDFNEMTELLSREVNQEGTYVNLGRTREDHLGHQTPLWATETVFNKLYGEALGMPIDIGSTAHGMSLDVAKRIVKEGPKMGVEYPHPTFIIAAKEMKAKIKSFEVRNVLSSETPEQSRPAIETDFDRQFPSYGELHDAWKATQGMEELHSKTAWERRFKLEEQYLRVLAKHLGNFGLSVEKEEEIRQHISHAIEGIAVRKERVGKYLEISEGKLAERQDQARAWVEGNTGKEKT